MKSRSSIGSGDVIPRSLRLGGAHFEKVCYTLWHDIGLYVLLS